MTSLRGCSLAFALKRLCRRQDRPTPRHSIGRSRVASRSSLAVCPRAMCQNGRRKVDVGRSVIKTNVRAPSSARTVATHVANRSDDPLDRAELISDVVSSLMSRGGSDMTRANCRTAQEGAPAQRDRPQRRERGDSRMRRADGSATHHSCTTPILVPVAVPRVSKSVCPFRSESSMEISARNAVPLRCTVPVALVLAMPKGVSPSCWKISLR